MSATVTSKLQALLLPCASLAVQVTVVVPTAKAVPLAGLQLAVVPGQLSIGVGVAKVTTELHWPASAFCVMLAGQEMLGA